MRGMSEKERGLRDQIAHQWDVMETAKSAAEARGGKFSKSEADSFDAASASIKRLQSELEVHIGQRKLDNPESFTRGANLPEVQGTPAEEVRGGQMTEWVRRAAENGVSIEGAKGRVEAVKYVDDEYLNQYWGERMGIARYESRALQEDVTGSGLAVVPQAWTASVIDYLYPMTLLGRAGLRIFPQPTEIYNRPVLTAPVQPAWLAEMGAIGIDASPALSSIQHNATGGFKDITLISRELLQDAYVNGGLPALLRQSVARNMALAVDVAGIAGIAGNAGNPGLVNEAGFEKRTATGDSGAGVTFTDTTELSKIAEYTENQNVPIDDPSWGCAYLSHNNVKHAMSRLNASTYARYWEFPPDVADLCRDRWFTSANANVVTTTETDAGVLTGGTMSSIYFGPWAAGYMAMGLRLGLETEVLRERFADVGAVGLFSFMRFSIRTAQPQTFSRTPGILNNS